MPKEAAAHRSREHLWTRNFFSLVKADTIVVHTIAAQLADNLFGLAMLCRCHAIERPVGFSFNGYKCVLDNSDPSFLFLGIKNRARLFRLARLMPPYSFDISS